MDKKKVKELIEQAERLFDKSREGGFSGIRARADARNCLKEAKAELSKSDWVSVEDRLPEYDEDVFVCDKACPSLILRTMRLEGIYGDNHNFIISHIYVTHWRRIEKLEE